jgi:DHA1 family bicyclomycin/chloramphenicol resistance-like MFS transporter
VAGKASSQSNPVSILWLIFAGVCAPFGFNVIPALLPAIQAEFVLDQSRMQWMVSFYALTMALGQLIGGPLSDAFGRRRIFLTGLAIFICASIGASLADSYPHLLAFRFMQGIGACAALVIPRAVVRDCYAGPDAARAMALIMLALAITPALAPLVGGLMQTYFGWRAGFVACALVGATIFTLALKMHGETLPPHKRVRAGFGGVLVNYAGLFRSWRFCAYAFAFSLLNCSFIGFFVIGPTYLTRAFGMTPMGVSFAMLAGYIGFAIGNMLAARHVRRAGVDRLLSYGLAFGLAGSLLLAVVAYRQPVAGWMLLAICIQSFGTGLSFPTGIAGATAVFPERAGTASAMTGAIQLGSGALFAVVSGAIDDGTLKPLAWSSLVLCAGAAVCVWPLWRRREPVGGR